MDGRILILDRDRIFLSFTPLLTLGPNLSSIQLNLELFPGVGLPKREAHHSSLSSAEVKNAWSFTISPKSLHTAPADMMEQRHLFMKYCTL
jgi:hypothetical protein